MSYLKINSRSLLIILVLLQSMFAAAQVQHPTNDPKASKVLLPNGWSLSPAGRSLPLGDLPLNIALSHNKKLLAVTNNGVTEQSIQLIDPVSENQLDQVTIKKAWYGLRFSEDDKKLYVSAGNDNMILVYPLINQKIGMADTITLGKPWPKQYVSPTGIEVDDHANRLYVVTKEDSALYVVNLKDKVVLNKLNLGHEAYSCALSPDKSELYISLWGYDQLLIYNTRKGVIDARIATEEHPNEVLVTKNGKTVFVANATNNSVSVIDVGQRKVIETISATLYPTKLQGSTTNGLALSDDQKTLYIANADNNCLAVFNVSNPGRSTSKGFIPTGWYPTSVKVARNKVLVSNGKGFSSFANPDGPQPISLSDTGAAHKAINGGRGLQYIGGLFKGTLSFIDQPDEKQLNVYSNQVYANTPYNPQREKIASGEAGNPIPRSTAEKSPIKHVFYIIKENRTYDQVLGDIKEGNGDPNLCLFTEEITPNQHALARQFVLLDNFYVDAEVSADGHKWSMGAYATDYLEKTWPTSYSKRGDDYEPSKYMSYPKSGYIWDYCKRAGISYRTYGEFGLGGTIVPSLKGHVATKYAGFNLGLKDVERIKVFKHDFDSLLTINQVPQLSTIRLSNDHTNGQRVGTLSPISMVADNDLALGQLVEYISKSPIWKESAIFVLEDDAQNGPDHIDAHRSPAYLISPYIKMGTVNSNMYSTSGMVRTIELILGLPPMSQYDAGALPMFDCFTSKADLSPFIAKPARVSLDKRNVAVNKSSERSQLFNFAVEDAAPDLDLNDVVWKSVKGENSVMPAPRRSAFIKLQQKKDDDD
jgi:YVTN family beta-propeller protein